MKKINILLAALLFTSLFIGCNDEEEAEVFQNRAIAGVAISVEGKGELQGEPANPSDLETSTVNFLSNSLTMNVDVASIEDESIVSGFEVVKQYNGGEEISVGTFESLPFSVNLTEVSEFVSGTSVSESDLRIGDVFKFSIKVLHNDGKSYYYDSQALNITVNCFADLTGTYTVTNSVCGTGSTGTIPPVKITKTPDGNWELETADGGLLQYCSSNTTIVNSGTISVICGVISGTTDYCGSNGIGCITGGSWDQEAGILILELNDTFFDSGDYTATYTRQE